VHPLSSANAACAGGTFVDATITIEMTSRIVNVRIRVCFKMSLLQNASGQPNTWDLFCV